MQKIKIAKRLMAVTQVYLDNNIMNIFYKIRETRLKL